MGTDISSRLLQALTESATNRRFQDSLERVKAACDFLESTRAPITPTAVGRYCTERWGGPKAQSIRNAEATLFAYLKARRAEQVLPPPARNGDYEPQIQDETIRAYVSLLKAERDEAIRSKNRIVAGLRNIPGIPIDELIRDGHLSESSRKTSAAPNGKVLKPQARAAIECLLDAGALASVGLELYRMRIRDSLTNQVLLEKQHVEALTELLERDKEADQPKSIADVNRDVKDQVG